MQQLRLALAATLGWLLGCNLHPPNNDTGGAINLASAAGYVVAARGTAGLDVVRLSDGKVVTHVDPQGDSDSYDDVAGRGAMVVALDADDGRLTSFRLGDDGSLEAMTLDLEVDASPYSGVAMSGDRVVVSGGICGIALYAMDGAGRLTQLQTLEAFRGQPDVTMLELGQGAILSTHFSGSNNEFVDGAEFGVSSLRVDRLSIVDTLGLLGAGVTEGGGRPASWPVRAASSGEFVYVAHGGGLEILRLGASLSLARISHTELETHAVDVSVSDGSAYLVGAAPARLVVFDVRSAEAPVLLRDEALSESGAQPSAVLATPEGVFIAAGPAGLLRKER